MPTISTVASGGQSASEPQIRAAEYVRMSTDHQQYSILNQSALIRAYAEAHGMLLVRSYADPGRSGLTLRKRPGLSRLLADIVGGEADFQTVLVYDVSRWGRFQDADESAHYEFLCRRAGISVIYCAEQFSADGTPFGSVLKALKRAMAGEYSRELSVKVAAGKARVGKLGFRVGGVAGYGLRRQVLEDGERPGIVLRDHQRKAVQTDRVVLVPGPAEEIQVVRRIYRDYIYLRRSERQIADDLNDEAISCQGKEWSRNIVRTILSNEKYIGNNIVGRTCQPLRERHIQNAPETWTRCNGAFMPIVPLAWFEAAAQVRSFNEKTYISREQILDALRSVLRREGRLTCGIINAAPELPSANTVSLRLGSLGRAYEAIGYEVPRRYAFHSIDRRLDAIRLTTEQALVRELASVGIDCAPNEHGLLVMNGSGAVEVSVCRYQRPRSYQTGWRLVYERNRDASVLVAMRMDEDNSKVRDYLLLSRHVAVEMPRLVRAGNEAVLAPYRHETIQAVAQAMNALSPRPY